MGNVGFRAVFASDPHRSLASAGQERWALSWRLLRSPMPPCVRLRESSALELLRPWQPTWVAWCGAWRLAVVKSLDAEGHYVPRLAELLSDGQRGGLMARQVPSEAFLYIVE